MDAAQINDRYWLTRHYVCASTLATFAVAALSPGLFNARAMADSGNPPAGVVLLALLCCISLLGLAESAAAHWIRHFHTSWLRSQRHTIFMGIALGQASTAYLIAAYTPESSALILRLALDAAMAAALAFLDLFARHKADRC